ncbi:MAG: hypothetical protein ACR2JO_01715 [Mycobacteriales bacterium]
MMNRKSPALAVFAGYDAGHHGLPAELLDARAVLLRVDGAARADLPPASEAEAVEQLARQLAAADTATADAGPVLDLRRQQEAYAVRSAIYTRAVGLAAGQLNQTVADSVDDIITGYLAPVVAEIAADLAKYAPTIASLNGADERALLSAPRPVAAAWFKVDQLAARYAALQDCRSRVLTIAGDVAEHDLLGLYAELENTQELLPEMLNTARPVSQLIRPWANLSTRERLVYFATNGGRLWLPTRAQQETAWLAVFGERLERARTNQQAAVGWRAAFGA